LSKNLKHKTNKYKQTIYQTNKKSQHMGRMKPLLWQNEATTLAKYNVHQNNYHDGEWKEIFSFGGEISFQHISVETED